MQNHSLVEYKNDKEFSSALQQLAQAINPHKSTIAFIEPYGSTLALVKHGVAQGFNIIIFTAHSDLRILPDTIVRLAHFTIKIDTSDEGSVLEMIDLLHASVPLNAVIPGFEYFLPIAAKASHQLNLPCILPRDVMQLRRKDLMRIKLQKAGIQVPRFYILSDIEEINNAIDSVGFPLVVKPIDAAGSVYVKKATHHVEALKAGITILTNNEVLWGHNLAKVALFEQYIGGKEYSLEGIITHNKVLHFSLTEKHVNDQSEFIEIGHIVNPPIAAETKKLLETYVEKVILALGANHCPFHAEVRINENAEPILMEIAARLAGDKIGDLINLSREINYYDYIFSAYLGREIEWQEGAAIPAGIRFFYRPHVESYHFIEGLEELKSKGFDDVCIYYAPDHFIPAFPKPLRRLGHIIIKENHYDKLCKALDFSDDNIKFI